MRSQNHKIGVVDHSIIVHATYSLALQHGVPLELIAERLRGLRFEPAGLTDDHEIPEATSVMDYVARRLAAGFSTD